MLTLNDINTIESDEDVSELDYYLVVQRVINNGMWSLQGSCGRTMMDAIKAGYCMLGTEAARDYYGNGIPSRNDVQPGTKGSYDFVVDTMGAEWAEQMASV
jgi:hypothetical protein